MFRRFLGLDRGKADPRLPAGDAAPPLPDSAAETATARRIVARLEALPREEARYLACFAYVMSRAANADFDISADETDLMERFAVEQGGLDEAQAVLVVEMAKLQARTQGSTEDFVVTREFRSISTPEQRRALVRCCFAIQAVDGSISAVGGIRGERDRPGAGSGARRGQRDPDRVPRAAVGRPGAPSSGRRGRLAGGQVARARATNPFGVEVWPPKVIVNGEDAPGVRVRDAGNAVVASSGVPAAS